MRRLVSEGAAFPASEQSPRQYVIRSDDAFLIFQKLSRLDASERGRQK